MNSNWVNIFNSGNPIKIQIIQQMLIENNIKSVILNQQDSSYNMFGLIKLYVMKKNEKEANYLIKEHHNERKI